MQQDNSYFLAHISEDGERVQTVKAHLEGTAKLAERFAAAFNAEQTAYFAGLLHDIGKYSEAFQRRIKETGPKVDHSTAGAREAVKRGQPEAGFAIAGHHGGLPNGGGRGDISDASNFRNRLKKPLENCEQWKTEITLPQPGAVRKNIFDDTFFTRMLFSCLVDADFLDTEAFMKGEKRAAQSVSMQTLIQKLENYIEPWRNAENELNKRRCKILRACLDKGETGKKGLYTLTVPTGGGKTVSSLAFALKTACINNMNRVIYVIPYTSIIDQTAQVFKKILGEENVLEHHSGIEYDPFDITDTMQRKKALAAENWDAPVVVTTAVQFFESLYSNKPSRCRKLHNIANSVIIFDEAQTLPVPCLRPCVAAIVQLVKNFEATAVLCTATQPALEKLIEEFAPGLPVNEICPDTEAQYEFFKRTTLYNLNEITEETLLERLNGCKQALCVVNERKTAQRLFSKFTGEGNYCLTTLICPSDRKKLFDEIKERLKTGQLCRVVSTSLIEAGVDLDFPAAFREEAGMDSVLQTAGRCNREGKNAKEESPVCIFRLSGSKFPVRLGKNIASTRNVLLNFDDPSMPQAIKSYFEFFYTLKGDNPEDKALDEKGIIELSRSAEFPFKTIAEKFQMIASAQKTVYIPLPEAAELLRQLRNGEYSRGLFRKLGKFGVSVYERDIETLDAAGLLEAVDDGNSYILTDINQYDKNIGLKSDAESGRGFFS